MSTFHTIRTDGRYLGEGWYLIGKLEEHNDKFVRHVVMKRGNEVLPFALPPAPYVTADEAVARYIEDFNKVVQMLNAISLREIEPIKEKGQQ